MTNKELEYIVESLVELKHLTHKVKEIRENLQTLRLRLMFLNNAREDENTLCFVFKILDEIETTLDEE